MRFNQKMFYPVENVALKNVEIFTAKHLRWSFFFLAAKTDIQSNWDIINNYFQYFSETSISCVRFKYIFVTNNLSNCTRAAFRKIFYLKTRTFYCLQNTLRLIDLLAHFSFTSSETDL